MKKSIKSSNNQVLKLEAKYAKNLFQQNRYSFFDSHVMRKGTAYNNEMGLNTKVLL